MNIGFVSTWFERGAAYVTKAYIEALKDKNTVFVYARGGELFAKGSCNWDLNYVTWGLKLQGTRVNWNHFKRWIQTSNLDVIFFNEQRELEVIPLIKKAFPAIRIGCYVDYYKEETIKDFAIFDFLICNTKRHYSVFKWHPQCHYVPWGTDIDLFKPLEKDTEDQLTFFHSVGMSTRKGTDILLKAFVEGKLYHESKLIIHSQLNFQSAFGHDANQLRDYNIEVIEKTVTAPGLYYLADVYVYPTTLEGVGLTTYEALSCGLPVIVTNNAPMNEVVNNEIGYLVEVEKYHSRSDGYYWPVSICNINSLISGMKYFVDNVDKLSNIKKQARAFACRELNWQDRFVQINKIFDVSQVLDISKDIIVNIMRQKKDKPRALAVNLVNALPDKIIHMVNSYILTKY